MTSPYRFFACLLIGSLLSACSPPPDYQDHSGRSGRFDDLRGQWLVINYWATWCKPCVEEIPELNELAAAYPERVQVFGIDFDNQQGNQLQQAIAKLGIEFPVLTSDPAMMLGYKRPSVLPTTFIIDAEGHLQATLKGPQTLQSITANMDLSP